MTARAMVEAVAEENRPGFVMVSVDCVAVARYWFDPYGSGLAHVQIGSDKWCPLAKQPLTGESREAFALRIVGAK